MTKGISETAFSTQVEDLLKLYQWRWTHFRPAWSSKGYRTPIKGHKGFPDYVCVRPPRLIFAEIKSEIGKLSPEQDGWLDDLRECVRMITLEPIPIGSIKGIKLTKSGGLIPSLEVYLWRPSQFEEILEILK